MIKIFARLPYKLIVKYSLLDSNDAARVRLKNFQTFYSIYFIVTTSSSGHSNYLLYSSVESIKIVHYSFITVALSEIFGMNRLF